LRRKRNFPGKRTRFYLQKSKVNGGSTCLAIRVIVEGIAQERGAERIGGYPFGRENEVSLFKEKLTIHGN